MSKCHQQILKISQLTNQNSSPMSQWESGIRRKLTFAINYKTLFVHVIKNGFIRLTFDLESSWPHIVLELLGLPRIIKLSIYLSYEINSFICTQLLFGHFQSFVQKKSIFPMKIFKSTILGCLSINSGLFYRFEDFKARDSILR